MIKMVIIEIEEAHSHWLLPIRGHFFEEENFILKRTGPGILSIANARPNTSCSRFFICTAETERLRTNTAFGKVTAGMNVMEAMERSGFWNSETSKKIIISISGQR